ncbi:MULTISPECIES: Fe2+-dependent dioxygenase [Pseudomonas]|uniref:Fe2+-dependent dioxygenase n=1 Tax=Pseudomonas TaxID=286 RepID=UPI00249AB66A|nr:MULTISPECIES: Fe2+-dependent dioxygenase [Pseudomonas]MEC6744492.1 Fe2+-dependent dioxygenase [Pseudomonas qingdaonensis]
MHYLIIQNALSAPLFTQVRAALGKGSFSDGRATANGLAQAAKRNLQLAPEGHAELLDCIAQALLEQPLLQAFAMPWHVGRPMINRYAVGMAYGMHADAAHIGDLRTDISYTLFLDDPASYAGGELVIDSEGQQFSFKLPAGSLLLYPSGALHEVREVTAGVRHAAVGWIQSRIRDAGQREIIAKLKAVPPALGQGGQHQALAVQTNECIQRLVRMWCD